MNFKTGALFVVLCAATKTTTAFVAPSRTKTTVCVTTRLPLAGTIVSTKSSTTNVKKNHVSSSRLYSSSTSSSVDDEVERLRSMAQKYRAEASALEAEKAQQIVEATERAFAKLDTNKDGEISLDELKVGLEKVLKTELKDERVEQLMKEFDESGDGAIQFDEFKGIQQFSRRLEQIIRDEKAVALEAKKAAKAEAEAAALAQAKLEMINDKEPSTTDKAISVLPYLFPLLDGLQFGRFLLDGDTTNNPFLGILGTIFLLYRSVPFSGLIAFVALSFLSGNLNINRLIRYNMQQAIYLDIALFVPGLVAAVYTLILSGLGVQAPEIVTQVGNDAIFVGLLVAIAYSSVSSALGITPDKIPFISDRVSKRMPTIDMFDDEGRFIPRFDDNKDDDKKD